jgi:hypothetical protein
VAKDGVRDRQRPETEASELSLKHAVSSGKLDAALPAEFAKQVHGDAQSMQNLKSPLAHVSVRHI